MEVVPTLSSQITGKAHDSTKSERMQPSPGQDENYIKPHQRPSSSRLPQNCPKKDFKPSILSRKEALPVPVLLVKNQASLNPTEIDGTLSTTSKLEFSKKIALQNSESYPVGSAVQPKKLCIARQTIKLPKDIGLSNCTLKTIIQNSKAQTEANNCIATKGTKYQTNNACIPENKGKFSEAHLQNENQTSLNISENTSNPTDKVNVHVNQCSTSHCETKTMTNPMDKMKPTTDPLSVSYNETEGISARNGNKANTINSAAPDDAKTTNQVQNRLNRFFDFTNNGKTKLSPLERNDSSNLHDFSQYKMRVLEFQKKLSSPTFKPISKNEKLELLKGNQCDPSRNLKQNETPHIGIMESKKEDSQSKLDSEKLALNRIVKNKDIRPIHNIPIRPAGLLQNSSFKPISKNEQLEKGNQCDPSRNLKQNETPHIGIMESKKEDSQNKLDSEKLALNRLVKKDIIHNIPIRPAGLLRNSSALKKLEVTKPYEIKIEGYVQTIKMLKTAHKARVKNLKKEIQELKRKIRRKDNVIKKLKSQRKELMNESYLPKPNGKTNFQKDKHIFEQILQRYVNRDTGTFDIIMSQIRKPDDISGKGNRWVDEVKRFAFRILKASPQTYKILSSYLHLPSERTLFREFAQGKDLKALSDSNDKMESIVDRDDEVGVDDSKNSHDSANPEIMSSVFEMDHSYATNPEITPSVEEVENEDLLVEPNLQFCLFSQDTEKESEEDIINFLASGSDDDCELMT